MKFLTHIRSHWGVYSAWQRWGLCALAAVLGVGALVLVFEPSQRLILARQTQVIEQLTPDLLSAVTANDATRVQAWMALLEKQPGVQRAELVNAQGVSVAVFARADQEVNQEAPFALASQDDVAGQAHVTIPLSFDGMGVAQLQLVLSVWPAYQRAMAWVGIALLIMGALYAAYTQGQVKIHLDQSGSHDLEAEDFDVHQALRQAMAQAHIHLKFQPRSGLNDGGAFGMEVWVSWPQADGRLVQRLPADFVEEASQDGMSLPLADWVLETACQQAAQWQRTYGPLVLVLNISARQLQDPQFPNHVRAICDAAQFPHQSLVFEVNERVMQQDLTQSLATIQTLIGQGLRLMVAQAPRAA